MTDFDDFEVESGPVAFAWTRYNVRESPLEVCTVCGHRISIGALVVRVDGGVVHEIPCSEEGR